MLMLPIPAVAALCLAYLALRSALTGRRAGLAVFLAACALQSLGIALAAGYGISALRPVLPISAAMIPPLAWITCTAALIRPACLRRDWPHAAGPLACLLCRLLAPALLDIAVALVFAGYGAAILLTLRRGTDLPLARLDAGARPARLWRGIGAMLVVLALGDLLIAFAHASGHADWSGWILSALAALVVVSVGLLPRMRDMAGTDQAGREASPPPVGVAGPATPEQMDIVERLDALLCRDRLYLDPGLTLQRLARRMRLPEKRLSAAVNDATGGNLSRHVNRWRIDHACARIAAGESLTEAMLASGFNTKSNFNREFLRVRGQSPGQWARQAAARASGPAPAADPDRNAPDGIAGQDRHASRPPNEKGRVPVGRGP